MKNKIILLSLVMSILLFFSCQREHGSAVRNGASAGNDSVEISSIRNQGYALRANTAFYTILGDDAGDETTRVRWAAGMSLGEKILTGETRRMTLEDGRVFDFIAVSRDNGTEGYAFAAQVGVGGSLAVVVDESANLFRAPRPVDVSGIILSRKSVVVYYPETENNGFLQVRGFDPARQANIALDNNYVRLSSLSSRDSDIQSAILLQTALSLPPAQNIRREALLNSALYDFPNSVFNAEIFEIVFPDAVASASPEINDKIDQ
ncbi:MAG: hypothetical protein FWD87_09320 [Spirochaetaceae bacterium]|nr:hypothetical protein [Spirochaetaceae bacterium]